MTVLKDFAPLGASLFSILIAGAAFWVARSQKKINANAYRLNLFKERFAAYKKFQERYEFIPKDEDELVFKLEKKTYPDSSYMSMLEEVYLLFDKDHTIENLMKSIRFFQEKGFLNLVIVDDLLQKVENEKNNMHKNLGKKDVDLTQVISNEYTNILYSLFREGLTDFPNNDGKYMYRLDINYGLKEKLFVFYFESYCGFVKKEIRTINEKELFKEYKDTFRDVENYIKEWRKTYTTARKEEEHYHYEIIANERTSLDQIKEMMERKLSLPSNPTD
ncbi:hypothetical protein [Saccharibacter floricola]|uniref:hypothetical protein n=1 Tax=Saccharibacter floricola TaxID=231053 RepID=UPI00223204EB|nr:hypothetical protein [Saccharibacter floricola]